MPVYLAYRSSIIYISTYGFLSVIVFAEPESATRTIFLNIKSVLLDLSYLRPLSLFGDIVPWKAILIDAFVASVVDRGGSVYSYLFVGIGWIVAWGVEVTGNG